MKFVFNNIIAVIVAIVLLTLSNTAICVNAVDGEGVLDGYTTSIYVNSTTVNGGTYSKSGTSCYYLSVSANESGGVFQNSTGTYNGAMYNVSALNTSGVWVSVTGYDFVYGYTTHIVKRQVYTPSHYSNMQRYVY